MKQLLTSLLIIGLASTVYAQEKTYAFFMVGNYASPKWEKLAFDLTKSGKEITYSYRSNEQGHKLEVLGIKNIGPQKALRVRMRETNKTYIILRDKPKESILMMSEEGAYKKRFPLGYEGPINGRGTFCAICANEPAEAFGLLNTFFSL